MANIAVSSLTYVQVLTLDFLENYDSYVIYIDLSVPVDVQPPVSLLKHFLAELLFGILLCHDCLGPSAEVVSSQLNLIWIVSFHSMEYKLGDVFYAGVVEFQSVANFWHALWREGHLASEVFSCVSFLHLNRRIN